MSMTPPNAGGQQPQGPPIPVEEFARLRNYEIPDFPEFYNFWGQIREKFYQANRTDFHKYHLRNLVNQNYLDSQQFRHIDPESGRMFEYTPEREWAHVDNQYEYSVESMVANAVKSNPRLVVKVHTDDKAIQGDLRMAQHYVDCDKPLTDREEAISEYLRVLRSRVWFYTFPTMSGPNVKSPVYGEQQIGEGTPAASYCPQCSRSGAETLGAGDGVCQFCGAMGIISMPATEAPTVTTQSEETERPSCRIITKVIDDFNMRWYLGAGTPADSPVLIYDRLELREDVYAKYGWLRPTMGVDATSMGSDIHLRAKDEAQRSAGQWSMDPFVNSGLASRGGNADNLRCHVIDMWVQPSQYRNFFHKKQEGLKLANGMMIPPYTFLHTIWPNGVCIVFVDGEMVDLRHENFNDYWDTDEFKPNPAGGNARGSEVMVANQNIHNALRIFQMVHLATEAHGNLVGHPGKITRKAERENIGKTGRIIWAHGLLPGENPANALGRIQSGAGGAFTEAQALEVRNLGSMQAHSQTYSVNPNVDKAPINTATGVNEMSEQVAQLAEPRLKRRAEVRASIQQKRLRFAIEHDHDKRYFSRSDETGKEIGKWMVPAALQGEFYVEFDPESHVIRTTAQRKSDVAIGVPLALQALGIRAQFPDAGENLYRIIMETFKLDDLVKDGRRDSETIAYKRINKIKQACAELGPQIMQQVMMIPQPPVPMVDPMTGEPVDLVEQFLVGEAAKIIDRVAKPQPPDEDDVIIQCLGSYWRSSEGQDDDEFTQKAIMVAQALQMRAKQEKEIAYATMAGQKQAALAAPAAEAAAAAMMDQKSMEAGQAGAEADAEFQRAEAGRNAESDRQEKSAEAGHMRNVEMQQVKQQGALANTLARPAGR